MVEEENKKEIDDKKMSVNLHGYHHHLSFVMKIILAVIIVFIIAGGAFAVGRISSNRNIRMNRAVPEFNQFGGREFSMMDGGKTGRGLIDQKRSGEITKIDGDNLTVKIDDKEYTVVISDSTSIEKDDEIAKKSDLKDGDNVSIVGRSDAYGQIQAEIIIINN
jgi:DNA-directed RNA polymerase subunit H (RpoH/RPB5)